MVVVNDGIHEPIITQAAACWQVSSNQTRTAGILKSGDQSPLSKARISQTTPRPTAAAYAKPPKGLLFKAF
jgi:hypothetical protein